ncbi:MAG: TadE/TadG family type IV pilus assembly protein [Alteraurantiacibacter sp.]
MLRKLRNHIRSVGQSDGGNATLLVALGMPVLIGGAGLGVDMTQWYMWKRELQFAVDQAAVAGAWARTDSDTELTYSQRAKQEFDANLSVTDDFNADPTIALANYAGGTLNSVRVSATATKTLPFTNFLTGGNTQIYAFAQASFEEGAKFTSCLVALDEEDSGALTIGGNSVLTASCGLAALSTAGQAITVNGNPTVDAGWILAAGGIDDWLKENTDDIILEYMEGLYDPFGELEPPTPAESEIDRVYSCDAEPDITTATVVVRTVTTYSYYQGSNERNASGWSNADGRAPGETLSDPVRQTVPNGTQAGTKVSSSDTWRKIGSENGKKQKWERKQETVQTTYSEIEIEEGKEAGFVRPGTYTDIKVSCDTAFAPGVYNIVGGGLKITGQHEVVGGAVMFVLYDGGYVDVAGGADISLTAMQASDLISLGVDAADANDLAGMLVFEDRDSEGSNKTKFNGNANTVMNGALYFPVSNVQFAGTVGVTSQCLMIAANNITITGTTNMSTFCPGGSTGGSTVASTAAKVRLVA